MQETESKKKRNIRKYHGFNYTREQKLVATVWYHERLFTGISIQQLRHNFLIRFNLEYPSYSTLRKWEKMLFEDDGEDFHKKREGANSARWVHVPYVKESLSRYPVMTLEARAQLHGMPKATLHHILKKDLKDFNLGILEKVKTKNIANTTEDIKKNQSTQ